MDLKQLAIPTMRSVLNTHTYCVRQKKISNFN